MYRASYWFNMFHIDTVLGVECMFVHINIVVGVMVVYLETGWSILFEM